MILIFNFLLFITTFLGGSVPIWSKLWDSKWMHYLLALSGSFLLSITFLHLIPESVYHLDARAGLLLLAGFFLQQVIQRLTHGLEHGHVHFNSHSETGIRVWPVFAGLLIHAFSEGIPLGMVYADENVLPTLFLAISVHKLPEAMLLIALIHQRLKSRRKAWVFLFFFSLVTPVASLLSFYLGAYFNVVHTLLHYLIPVIAGVFIHIGTTIFFESGTRSHEMTWRKWVAMLLGIALGILSIFVTGISGGHVH